jgi:hypothetical protein
VETTRITKSDFDIAVPVAWTEKRGPDGVEFHSADGKHQLVLSVVALKKALPLADRRATVEQLMEARRAAFAQRSGGKGMLVPLGGAVEGDSCYATSGGADVAAGVLAYVRIEANASRVVTASVYRYGDAQDSGSFATEAEEICSTLKVTSRPVTGSWRRWLPW